MGVTIEVVGTERLKKYLDSIPNASERILKNAVKKAGESAHKEALIQISRKYTTSMSRAEKDLRLIIGTGSTAYALFKSSGRPRGARNFNVYPKESSPSPAWTSKKGYSTEIIREQYEDVSRDYFWIRGKNNNLLFARRKDVRSRTKESSKNLKVFKTVSTPQMLGNPDVLEKVEAVTRETLEAVFMKNMQRHLTKG